MTTVRKPPSYETLERQLKDTRAKVRAVTRELKRAATMSHEYWRRWRSVQDPIDRERDQAEHEDLIGGLEDILARRGPGPRWQMTAMG